ncbi:hypothetical protein [uncultured Roseobacter sp.]|uniref:hypothetical protein n=1 Tax=uncultured Roseobacter sp. TaxID=114847 RepID=UPI002601FB5C|nr:hypothetical protein [uncultured Roseobacter sp.]
MRNETLGTFFGTFVGLKNGRADPQTSALEVDTLFEIQDAQNNEEAKLIPRTMAQMSGLMSRLTRKMERRCSGS